MDRGVSVGALGQMDAGEGVEYGAVEIRAAGGADDFRGAERAIRAELKLHLGHERVADADADGYADAFADAAKADAGCAIADDGIVSMPLPTSTRTLLPGSSRPCLPARASTDILIYIYTL